MDKRIWSSRKPVLPSEMFCSHFAHVALIWRSRQSRESLAAWHVRWMCRGKEELLGAAAARLLDGGTTRRILSDLRYGVETAPQALQKIAMKLTFRGLQCVVVPQAVPPRNHQPRAAKVGQMPRRRWLGNA